MADPRWRILQDFYFTSQRKHFGLFSIFIVIAVILLELCRMGGGREKWRLTQKQPTSKRNLRPPPPSPHIFGWKAPKRHFNKL